LNIVLELIGWDRSAIINNQHLKTGRYLHPLLTLLIPLHSHQYYATISTSTDRQKASLQRQACAIDDVVDRGHRLFLEGVTSLPQRHTLIRSGHFLDQILELAKNIIGNHPDQLPQGTQ
jgi:hypothetical protein